MKSTFKKPWGSYTIIDKGDNYVVKNILINPNSKASLQSHNYRSEHWVVVEGTLEATVNNKVSILEPNQSIYIPLNAKHRLSNNTDKNVKIIEVWYGKILNEEDIIRYEDEYNRKLK